MRATSNHFQPSQHLSNSDDNQFLLAPSRLTDNSKDEVIKKLQLKNQRLMTQIQKVEKVLSQQLEKTVYGNKLPQVNSKVTELELQNAYKQIKSYEFQIKKLRSINKQGTYVQQIKKNEATLKQKQQMSDRLRKQLADIKKQSMQLTKHLKNDNKKQQIQTKNVKLNTQIKWLRQKLREMEVKNLSKADNKQKQLAYIKKLENQLVESGYPVGSIRNLREKYTPAKDVHNQSYYSNGRASMLRNNNSYEQEQQKQQKVEDRTPQAYKSLQSQIKLLQKMQKDYLNQISSLQKQKQQSAQINLKSRNKLLEVEDQIERVEKRIQELKKSIDPSKIKPTRGLSMPNTSNRYGDSGRLTSLKEAFQHLFKNQQVGKLTGKGKRFSDRIKLGKNQSKIVGLNIFENKQNGNWIGIQATYQINSTLKKGSLNLITDIKQASKKSLTLFEQGDYFKSIECICNEKALIIGIAAMSAKGVACRAGQTEGFRRPINIARNQYPACVYGSFGENGIELFGVEVVQEK